MRLIGLGVVVGVLVGVTASRFAEWSAAGALVAFAVGAALMAVLARLLMPRLARGQMLKIHARGGELPPAGSERVESPLVAAWEGVINAGDFSAAARTLADGFVCECPQLGKTFRRSRYLRGLTATRRYFPQMRYTVHEVREAAGELWVHSTTDLKGRRGDPIVTESWDAWRVEGDQILRMRQGKVLEVSGAGTA